MPLSFLQKWPRTSGFEIYGKGPCYVTQVEKGSEAYHAGLMPGDQILEMDGRDVTTMSADQIKALAKGKTPQSPELEVVSCLQTQVLDPDHIYGHGLTICNGKPVTVKSVDYGGPAYKSGIRTGDIILEAKCHSHKKISEAIGVALSHRQEELTLLTIPVSRTSNMVTVDKRLSQVTAPDARLYTAKDLHRKLENLLGADYKSKMAVVSALKRYAEDRDITILCKVLNCVLRTATERHIIKQIRLLVPPSQRSQFDSLINCVKPVGSSMLPHPPSDVSLTEEHHWEQKKILQVMHESGSFGFTIKSSNPAYIESTDPEGAAEKAGLLPGDYLLKLNGIDVRKCDHDKLVQLLLDSGSAPTLEILRCAKFGSLRSTSSTSSSLSSHKSVDNILYSDAICGKDGYTFTNRANFLLTPKERRAMKKTLKSYDFTRDIVELYDSVSEILDTPSKKILWSFIFVLLSSPHREYVSHRVSLPLDVLMKIIKSNSGQSPCEIDDPEEINISSFPPSFQQQIDFLLTSTERSQFKSCLKDYDKEHELTALVMTLESVLDTPSKRILWKLVLPRLTDGHREVMKGRLDIHGRQTALLNLTDMDSYIGSPEDDTENDVHMINTGTNTEDDILFGKNRLLRSSGSSSDEDGSSDESAVPKMVGKCLKIRSRGEDNDSDLLHELEETRKAVEEMRDAFMAQGKNKGHGEVRNDDLDKDLDYLADRRYITVIPVSSEQNRQKHRVDSLLSVIPRKVKIPSSKSMETSEENISSYPIEQILSDNHIDNFTYDDNNKDVESDTSKDLTSQQFDGAGTSDFDASLRDMLKHNHLRKQNRVDLSNGPSKTQESRVKEYENQWDLPPPPPSW